MDAYKNLNQTAAEAKNQGEINQGQTLSNQPSSSEALPKHPEASQKAVLISFGFVIIVLAVVALRWFNLWKRIRSPVTTVQHFYQSPCRSCRFFSENNQLKCAVHPSLVLTEAAKDCPDQWPQD